MYPDQFQPEKVIAAGPSAKVYRGVETVSGRKVLIKVLMQDDETAHPLDRERLQLLAPALMQMRHPQIAGLITLLPTEEEFALVSEFMPGMNARTFAAERKPAPADLRALAVQLMHALVMGEHLRQPHGDPKPSNLIITDHPGGGLFLQVQDWGLSMARQTPPPETLWFRAPELHTGAAPTTQSDLFTAAGSLFCIATNTAPAQGTTVQEVMADWQAFNTGHVLSHLRPDLDPPLRDWLAWLLNLTPQLRPQSAAQALDALMRSMHTGFTYMPQQAPAMAPGFQTTPLVASPPLKATKPGPPGVPAARSALPKSAPPPATAATVTATPTEVPKKSARGRVVLAVALNLAAVVLIGFLVWPVVSKSMPNMEVSTAVSSDKATTTATPITPPDKAKDAVSAPAKPKVKANTKPKPAPTQATPASAVTEADAKGR